MRPDQIDLLQSVSRPSVHPHEPWAVVATSRPDFDADSYVGQLWRVPFTGNPRRITRGFADSAPQFSPDGSLIAFLRRCPGGKPQLYVVESGGGEPVALTEQHLGVGQFCWSPDSTALVYTARVAEEGRYGTLDGVVSGQEDPRHFDELTIQANGLGWMLDRPRQLFEVDVPDLTAEPPVKPVGRAARDRSDADGDPLLPVSYPITDDDVDWFAPVYTADGGSVVALAARDDDRGGSLATDLWRLPLDEGDPVRLTPRDDDRRLGIHDLRRAGDSRSFLVLAGELGSGTDFVGKNPGVYRVPADGGAPQRLTPVEQHVHSLEPGGDAGALVLVDERGRTTISALADDGSESAVLGGDIVASGVAAVPASDAVVAVRGTADSFGDVVLIEGAQVRTISDFSAALRDETTVAGGTELVVDSFDGYPVHGWVYAPDGPGPHPTLLVIHGGPFSAYTVGFFDEVQTYVAAGYAVVLCNPRGSAGYGEAHGQAITGDFGNLDYRDIIAFLEGALAQDDRLDPERLGVMGGSYGGYMTAWIIAHDHRFKGAIVERGYLDPASFVGPSDIGWFFTGGYNTTDLAQMNRQSPTLLTDQVTTPTLVMHSEEDIRCPLGQALRYYTQLKLGGVEAELLVFPGENHELSRSGTPWHRRQRFDAILDWWARRLG